MPPDRQIFSLKQVVSSIRKTIEDRYAQTYWVKAEIYKFNRFPSGHAFPEIVQRENDKIVAQLSGTIWKQNYERINQQFIEIVKEPLKDGSNLLMQVKITFSELYGLSLQILDIDPSFSLGEVQKQREETLKRLQKEGILNLNQQLSFPLLPKRIAVISADSSKGLSDFMEVLNTNEEGYSFFTFLFNAYLQGDQAVNSIIGTLEKIKKVRSHFDLVVIVRGGGAEVGMTCYNHYELCKAIATFPLPILTGIGHSTNFNVAEMIAYRNSITPTKLAEFLIQTFREFDLELNYSCQIIKTKSFDLLFNLSQQLDSLLRLFKQVSKHNIGISRQHLIDLTKSIEYNFQKVVTQNENHIKNIVVQITHNLKIDNKERVNRINEHQLKLIFHTNDLLISTMRNLTAFEKNLDLLDPFHVLKRGFSITRLNGKAITNSDEIENNIEIQTEVAKGQFRSVVKK
ncbi:MAG: exodeoxyribonuclease VII large subunit [Bacteroidetes bacterium]|nr:exodeoxyribonuclease VII large subunit [Bacteroidota bacterium]